MIMVICVRFSDFSPRRENFPSHFIRKNYHFHFWQDLWSFSSFFPTSLCRSFDNETLEFLMFFVCAWCFGYFILLLTYFDIHHHTIFILNKKNFFMEKSSIWFWRYSYIISIRMESLHMNFLGNSRIEFHTSHNQWCWCCWNHSKILFINITTISNIEYEKENWKHLEMDALLYYNIDKVFKRFTMHIKHQLNSIPHLHHSIIHITTTLLHFLLLFLRIYWKENEKMLRSFHFSLNSAKCSGVQISFKSV